MGVIFGGRDSYKLKQLDRNPIIIWGVIIITILGFFGFNVNIKEKFFPKKVSEVKNDSSKLLEPLAVEVTVNEFIKILGEPKFINDLGEHKEYVFVNEDFYCQAVTLKEKVLLFTVTTRKENFNPVINKGNPEISIKLGVTKFSDLSDSTLTFYDGFEGVRRYNYYEEHYYGNPGNYQTFFFGINDAGPWDYTREWEIFNSSTKPDFNSLKLSKFREQKINTFGVASVNLMLSAEKSQKNILRYLGLDFMGANSDQVRLLSK